jgi:hypothetical protein
MYAFFQMNHIVYGLFLALVSVCIIRGGLITLFFRPRVATQKTPSPEQRFPDAQRPDRKVLAPANTEPVTVN